MKKILVLFIPVLFLLVNSLNISGYATCTTTGDCPSGFTDNGTICEGKICYKQCYIYTCGNISDITWTQEFSDANKPHIKDQTDFDVTDSLGYTPTNTSRCYKFEYRGPSSNSCIQMNANESASPPNNCDSEAIVGFRDLTNLEDPWYKNIYTADSYRGPKYLGLVNKVQFDYMVKVARSHADGEGTSDSYKADLEITNSIYCANNSAICDAMAPLHNCTTGCYNKETRLRGFQGFLVESNSIDNTLYNGNGCGVQYVEANIGNYFTVKSSEGCSGGYYVYSAQANIIKYDTSARCDMVNEAPNITGVKILPLMPNAGQNLFCNYTYYDTENFTEQNSSYEWWKNNVNQNINSQILEYKNLTPGDLWFCKVSGSDGDKTSVFVQSENNVTINSTLQNPILYVDGNQSWNESGYYGITKIVDFDSQLRSALNSCTADAQGYCNISLTFFSNATGLLNITNINVYYDNPVAAVSVADTTLNLTALQSDNTVRLFEFTIINTGNSKISNLSWKLSTGEAILNSTQNVTLDASERLVSLIHYNYTTEGSFAVMANITYDNLTSNASLLVTIGNLLVDSMQELSRVGKVIVYEIKILNIRNESINNANWSVNISGADTYANKIYNLTSNESLYLYFEQNHTSFGEYQVKATAFNQNFTHSKTLTTLLKELVVIGLKVLNATSTRIQFEFLINNSLNATVNAINWTLNTGLTNVSSTTNITLQSNETVYVITDYNYTSSGTYAVNATARKNESSEDSQNISITV
ncbi:hypothetical protein HYV81_06005 [Candidatus Woesearchaeota archaeon]|nr:hypothetical protein [Candidatus Woesearchaeota archaeon]